MTKSTAVSATANIGSQAVANHEERQSRVGQGSQNVTQRDIMIPRIKLLQKISPEVDKSDSKFVEGAEVGMLMNSVSNDLMDATFVVNLNFDHSIVVWKKRKFGGGMFGSYPNESEAVAALEAAHEVVEQYDISENPTHLVMLLDGEGTPKGVALLDMPGTKAKISRKWNSLIQEQEQAGNPRFGCIWELSSTTEDSANGTYANYSVELVIVAGDEIYDAASSAFDNFFAPKD